MGAIVVSFMDLPVRGEYYGFGSAKFAVKESGWGHHNSLSLKKLAGHADLWSVRVTLDLHVVGHRRGDVITWVWIGTHNEFDKLFG